MTCERDVFAADFPLKRFSLTLLLLNLMGVLIDARRSSLLCFHKLKSERDGIRYESDKDNNVKTQILSHF